MTSPNFGPRKTTARPDLVVIHYTAMADCDAAERVLCSPDYEVSAHYLISERGEVTQLVNETERAWHAGRGSWGDITDVNSHSIGIELSNLGTVPFAAAQMDALVATLRGIVSRWDIPPERVIGHSDLAPGRKIDPGHKFDWARLAREGLANRAIPRAAPVDADHFTQLLTMIGYADVDFDTRLAAFRLRHRQNHAGPLDEMDMGLAVDLANRFPCKSPSDADPQKTV